MASYQDYLDSLPQSQPRGDEDCGCAFCGWSDHEVENCPKLAGARTQIAVEQFNAAIDATELTIGGFNLPEMAALEQVSALPAGSLRAADPSLASSLTPPQQAALDSFLSRAPRIIDEARAISITDEHSLQHAVTLQQDVKAAIDLLEAFKRPEINRAHQAHKAALGELQTLTAPWRTADTILSTEASAYQLRLRREREEAARRVQEEMQRVRDAELAKQLEQATQAGAQEEVQAVLERAATPMPDIPIVHTPVRVEGSITRGKHTYTLIDARKINLQWVLECILAEIATKGECKWLSTQIGREVRGKGKRAEVVVGVGSIEYSAGVSAGVRRRKG